MRSFRWLVRSLVLPAAATALLWLWWGSALARQSDGLPWWAAGFLFAGFGLSAIAPRVAIAFLCGAFLLQLLRPESRFDQSGWSPYLIVPVVAIVLAARTPQAQRRNRLAAMVLLGVVIGLFTNLPNLGPAIRFDAGAPVPSGAVGLVNGEPWAPLTTFGGRELVVGLLIWMVGAVLLIIAGWMIGSTYRGRRLQWSAQAEAAKAREALTASEYRLQVTEERDRVAQDVHDITAHSLSVIVAQADGAAAHSQDSTTGAALTTIATSARQALTELRGLLERMEQQTDGDTAHRIAEVANLIETVRAAGAEVDFVERGTPVALARAAELAVYRITQEALTNALRHGTEREAIRVVLDWQPDGLALTITSPIALDADAGRPAGRGVVGMQQRARLAGGWLTSGVDDATGNYLVTSHLPRPGGVVE